MFKNKKLKNILVIPAKAGTGTKQCERQRTKYIYRVTGFKDPIPAYAGMTKGGRDEKGGNDKGVRAKKKKTSVSDKC